MRKLGIFLLVLITLLSIPISAGAVTGAEQVQIQATVSADGSAQITQTVSLHLDQAVEDLEYPVPLEAAGVTLNGSRVAAHKAEKARFINLSRLAGKTAGTVTFTVGYRLADVIESTEEGLLQLQLPLLSGFAYPISSLEFSVAMPMEVTVKPAFTSGYHQSSIESMLDFDYSGAAITGSSYRELKDHETLTLLLSVSEEIFPQTAVELPTLDAVVLTMGILAALAFVYWLIWLRNVTLGLQTDTTAPAGCTAGQLGCVLTLSGPDLPLMVLSWAQLGYVLIHIDRNQLVTIHKCMEMGNERTGFERRCFQTLFSKREHVDTSSRQWALLCRKLRKKTGNLQSFIHPRSGNPLVFRALCAAVGMLSGVCLGLTLGNGAALQWPLVILFGALALVSSWFIQEWPLGLYTCRRNRQWLALLLCGIYLIFSAIAGLFGQGIWVCLCQLLGGLMAAFGGRRTPAGKQAMAQTFGLRRYLRTLPKSEIQRICEKDPDFFHTMMPWAMALGSGKAFAKRFGAAKQPACPYLTTGMDGHRDATEWYELMSAALDAMYLREQKLPVEKLMNILYSFTK